jgi:hypothetical protein
MASGNFRSTTLRVVGFPVEMIVMLALSGSVPSKTGASDRAFRCFCFNAPSQPDNSPMKMRSILQRPGRLSRYLLSLGLLAFATLSARTEVTQRSGESYDEYNTRRIQEETANFRNNNPTFTGPSASSQADWSSWQGMIDRYNARHSRSEPQPIRFDPEVRKRAQADADNQRLMARIDAQLEAARSEAFDRINEPAKEGKSWALLRVGQYFSSTGGRYLPDGEDPDVAAFNLYCRAGDGNSVERQACLLGAIPGLLDARQKKSFGWRLERLRDLMDGGRIAPEFAVGVLEKGVAEGDWVDALVLALWMQHYEISVSLKVRYPDHIPEAEQSNEYRESVASHRYGVIPTPEDRPRKVRELLELVKAKVPWLGTYFIGAQVMTASDDQGEYLAALRSIVDNPTPIPGDTEGYYSTVLQDEARRLLAQAHLKKRIPGARDDVALLLLRNLDGPTGYDGMLEAANLVFNEQVGVNPVRMLEAAQDFERISRAVKKYGAKELLGLDHKDALYKAHLLRALVNLSPDSATTKPGAGRNLMQAEIELSLALEQADSPVLRSKSEALTRYRAMCAMYPTDAAFPHRESNSAVMQHLRGATDDALAQSTLGLLYARGEGGLNRDPRRAIDFFQVAIDDKAAFQSLRISDVLAMAGAIDELLAAKEFEWDYRWRNVAIYRHCLSRLSAHEPEYVRFRLDRIVQEDAVRTAIATAIEKDANLENGIPGRLAALGDVGVYPAWKEAFALSGPARLAAIGKLPMQGATVLAQALRAQGIICQSNSVKDTLKAIDDLMALTAAGSPMARKLCERDDTRMVTSVITPFQSRASRWLIPYIDRSLNVALARFEEFHRQPDADGPWELARMEWKIALSKGYLPARAELARIQQEVPLPGGLKPNPSPHTDPEWEFILRLEKFVLGQPENFWANEPADQIYLVCQNLEKAGLAELLTPYLALETERISAWDRHAKATIGLLRARCLAKGTGVVQSIPDAQAALTYVLSLGSTMNLDLLREVQQLVAPASPEQRDTAEAVARIGKGFSATLMGEPPALLDKVYARAMATQAEIEQIPGAPDAAKHRGLRESVRLLYALIRAGHIPAYRELARRAEAGEADAQCALTVGLLQLSLANAPAAIECLKKMGLEHRDTLTEHWFDEAGLRTAVEGFLRGNAAFTPISETLALVSPTVLTPEMPFLLDPQQGESWLIRLMRKHVAANPADACMLFDAVNIERQAKVEEKTADEMTVTDSLRQSEAEERYNTGLTDPYIKALRLDGDPVSLALALQHNLPEEDDRLELLRTTYLEFATTLCQNGDPTNDPLLAYCQSIAHRALRNLAPFRPEAYQLLAAEAKKKRATAEVELALFLATRSSANAPFYLPLFERALGSKQLAFPYGDYAQEKLAQWQDPAKGRPLFAFLSRVGSSELKDGQSYFVDGRDDYDFSPVFYGDKPMRDDEVLRLLKKHASAGDKEAAALLSDL